MAKETIPGLGERLQKAREKRGLTQRQLAERARVSQQTISKLERGEAKSTTYVYRLAKVLEVSVDWLLAGEGPMYPKTPQEAQGEGLSQQAIQVAQKFQRLSPRHKAVVEEIIEAFMEKEKKAA